MCGCSRWTAKVLQEFFEQGDKERAKGMPVSPMMDRTTTQTPVSQINFIEYIVAPLFSEVLRIRWHACLPGTRCVTRCFSSHSFVSCLGISRAVSALTSSCCRW